MFAKHVSSLASAYCHDELSPEQSRRVTEHLISCQRCRGEFEGIRFGAGLAARLPLVESPDSLWSGIEIALDRDGRAKLAREPWYTLSFLKQPRFAVPLVCLVIGLQIFAYFWSQHARRLASSSWGVARLDGAPRIDSAKINNKGRLRVGQWLETDTNSRARIDVGNIGQVEIDPNTRVRLLETRPSEHRLELAQGRLSARISAPPKLFFVNTPSGIAEDLGCAYTLEVDDTGNSLLRVTVGWVALQLKDRESMVPAGAACVTRRGFGPGTPYFEDASASFRDALAKIDFESDSRSRGNSLGDLLRSARVRDTLTLWHLLSRVDGDDRARVYERMTQLTPLPADATREGVLALNQQMLESWKDKLESNWDDDSSPAMKALRRVWTSGLGRANGLAGKK
jgi:hypothetical protein